jgi:hypothetical protein
MCRPQVYDRRGIQNSSVLQNLLWEIVRLWPRPTFAFRSLGVLDGKRSALNDTACSEASWPKPSSDHDEGARGELISWVSGCVICRHRDTRPRYGDYHPQYANRRPCRGRFDRLGCRGANVIRKPVLPLHGGIATDPELFRPGMRGLRRIQRVERIHPSALVLVHEG